MEPTSKKGSSKDKNKASTSCDNSMFEEPSQEFASSTVRLSTSNLLVGATSSPGGRKRSFKKLSLGSSPLIPLNDDCNELIEEKEKSELEQDKPQNESTKQDEEQEMSIMRSMTMEQMQEHVARCLQLSTENKINAKNAFALKLIDCMTIMSKTEDESNFAAMACQLDAGAKIYSHRVDAVHQQVMKLAETCIFAEKQTKKKKGSEEGHSGESADEGEGPSDEKVKGKKRKNKKKVLATAEQISRKPKDKDPREQFVRLEALPGDILNKAKRDAKDLALTLDKHTPFWQDFTTVRAKGRVQINPMTIKSRLLGPVLRVDRELDLSSIPKLLIADDDNNDWCDDPAVLGNDEDDLNEKMEIELMNEGEKQIEEMEMVTQAKARMTRDGSTVPSRVDVIKAIFHQPGESEYHYLKMDNSAYWAGPSYWKRPHHVVHHEANKRKNVRKKKEPQTIEYTGTDEPELMTPMKGRKAKNSLALKNRSRQEKEAFIRKASTLSKRTFCSWRMKKVTYPPDIHFDPMDFQRSFHIYAVANIILDKSEVKEAQHESGEEGGNEAEDDFEQDFPVAEADNDDVDQDEQPSDPPPAGDPESVASKVEEQHVGVEAEAGPSSSSPGPSTGGPDVYEGDNLVPMVKTVKVEPIRYTARPNRVDMQHLKEIMLAIIVHAIEDRENEMRREGMDSPRGSVMFRDVLTELFSSDQLHHRTREDLTTQMAFLCLLTLTNEHSFSLVNDEGGDVSISYDPDEPRPSSSS